jgi:hypothetical protein
MHGGEVKPLERPVESVAAHIAQETRTRALPATARAGYAAAVR